MPAVDYVKIYKYLCEKHNRELEEIREIERLLEEEVDREFQRIAEEFYRRELKEFNIDK
jgi:hypothetical protein